MGASVEEVDILVVRQYDQVDENRSRGESRQWSLGV